MVAIAAIPRNEPAMGPFAPSAMAAVDIVGLSCRFPESANAAEFWENLREGRDMVTSNDSRWPVGLHETPPRFGKVPDYERFDASFFSVHGKQAQVRRLCQDPAISRLKSKVADLSQHWLHKGHSYFKAQIELG